MVQKRGDVDRALEGAEAAAEPRANEITSSGVVAKGEPPGEPPRSRPRRDSEPPSYRHLTPYQARLDVEMDDTAVSKVRDPSVSLRLSPEERLARRARRYRDRSPVASLVLGAVWGALLVLVTVALHRACSG